MDIGPCPYDDCGGTLMLEIPDQTPAYAIVDCEECGRPVWYRFSRLDPQAWTTDAFEAAHEIDHETRTIRRRQQPPQEQKT